MKSLVTSACLGIAVILLTSCEHGPAITESPDPPTDPILAIDGDGETNWLLLQAQAAQLQIHTAKLLPIYAHHSSGVMHTVGDMTASLRPLISYRTGRLDVRWAGGGHVVYDMDVENHPFSQGSYVYLSDAPPPFNCNTINTNVSATGTGYVRWHPLGWPLPGPAPHIQKGPATTAQVWIDCIDYSDPPGGGGGGGGDDCGGYMVVGEEGMTEQVSGMCEGWTCVVEDWGLFMWDGSQWVLIDWWEEENCYWGPYET